MAGARDARAGPSEGRGRGIALLIVLIVLKGGSSLSTPETDLPMLSYIAYEWLPDTVAVARTFRLTALSVTSPSAGRALTSRTLLVSLCASRDAAPSDCWRMCLLMAFSSAFAPR